MLEVEVKVLEVEVQVLFWFMVGKLRFYFAPYLIMPSDLLSAPVYVSTPVSDSIVVDRVHRSCIVVIGGLKTRADLSFLDMVDFDDILGIDWLSPWLSPYHAILDCHAKTARCMVEKGCLAYLTHVDDSSVVVPSTDSVPIVREFPEVFPSALPSMPLDRDIDVCIDLAPGTQPISIPPYPITPSELKELKK
ncbi:uncharacterized protein [Nicotiana sylvestris]|uniref:uncharacterized protein n=1 Tax=Nicotiana sylvestris TaxID=4096 RepID=UPI00388C4BD2